MYTSSIGINKVGVVETIASVLADVSDTRVNEHCVSGDGFTLKDHSRSNAV